MWFKKEAPEVPAPAPTKRVYKFEDYLDPHPELPEHAPRLDVHERDIKVLIEQVADLKVDISDLKKQAADAFVRLRNDAAESLKAEVIITDALRELIQKAVQQEVAEIFDGDEATEFGRTLVRASVESVMRKLGRSF
jgi:hypothetical protein